jgi:hypothetical protein
MMLALRLLTPAGFMPAFNHGAVAIVVCPDADPAPAMAAHHHHGNGQHQTLHQPCPYASVSGLGALAADFAPLVGVLVLAVALLLGRAFVFLERHRPHDRPPLRGPPTPA